jgi:hypothetical protein
MPSRRRGWPGSATSSWRREWAVPPADWRPARPVDWRGPLWRCWAAGWVQFVQGSALQTAARTSRRDKTRRCVRCRARTNHPDRRARTNRRSPPRAARSAAVWDGRRCAAARGSAPIPKDRGNQDRMASDHRLVRVVKKKKAPVAGSLCLFGSVKSGTCVRGQGAGTRAVGVVGYARSAPSLRESPWAAPTHPSAAATRAQKSPARFPARAHFMSFNFTNSLICGIVSSNLGAVRVRIAA